MVFIRYALTICFLYHGKCPNQKSYNPFFNVWALPVIKIIYLKKIRNEEKSIISSLFVDWVGGVIKSGKARGGVLQMVKYVYFKKRGIIQGGVWVSG